MAPLPQPLRLTVRRLLKAPLFTLLTVATLAVGIGSNSAVFSVLNAVLLEPLPFEDSERLVSIYHLAPGIGPEAMPQGPAFYLFYRENAQVFEESGMWNRAQVAVTGLEQPQQLDAVRLTEGVLPTLRVEPQLGRFFSSDDIRPDVALTVVLSDGYFRRQFGGDASVLGRTLTVNGRPRQVIGVAPAGLRFPNAEPSLFLPFTLDRAEVFVGNFSHVGVARLKPGVTLEQAQRDLARLIPAVLEAFPAPPGFSKEMLVKARLAPELRPLKNDVVGNVGQVLWILFGTVGLVLLVACANVANLFLVRTEGRHQELSVKRALGASRGQIAREMLGESLLLSALGCLVGLGLASVGIRLLVALAPDGLPRLDEIRLDGEVLVFTLGVSLLTALLFGSVAALRSGGELARSLKEEGRGSGLSPLRRRARNGLVVAQIALALVLLVGSGLLLRTFQSLRQVDPGFARPAELLSFRLTVPEPEIADPKQVGLFYQSLVERLQALPGVLSVGLASSMPMDGFNNFDPVFVEEKPAAPGQLPPIQRMKMLGPGYVSTLGTPMLAGRDFTWSDLFELQRVTVVSESVARSQWGSVESALGKRVRESPEAPWREVVGVVADVREAGVDQPPTPLFYWPAMMENWWQQPVFFERSMVLVVRSERVGSPGFLDEVQRTVWSLNGNLPLSDVMTADRRVQGSMARTTFTVVMLAIAALTALLLGAIGTYGVVSYLAAQRTREIGVRMALGAARKDVAQLVLRHGLSLALAGVGLGLVVAALATRFLAQLLYGVSPLDPLTYLVVGATVTVVAVMASYVPARRAANLDPIESLRR